MNTNSTGMMFGTSNHAVSFDIQKFFLHFFKTVCKKCHGLIGLFSETVGAIVNAKGLFKYYVMKILTF